MWELLKETWDELAKNWLTLLQCFWLPIPLTSALLYFLWPLPQEQFAYFAVYAVLAALVWGNGAVCWHRHVISGDQVSWLPRIPDIKTLWYGIKLIFTVFVFGATGKVGESIARDLLMPIVGLLTGGMEIGVAVSNTIEVIVRVVSMLIYVLILGPWMLRLPEGSLDQDLRGARKQWPADGKRHYLQAFAAVSFAAWALSELERHLDQADSVALALVLVLPDLAVSALAFSLLTVAYRRNMKAGESARTPTFTNQYPPQ
jgi:hypothetical protein